MQRIIDSIHQQYSDLADMRAREIHVDKQQRKVFCTLSYPDVLSLKRQNEITQYVKSLVPKNYHCAVIYSKDTYTSDSFRSTLTNLFKSRYPLFSSICKNMNISVSNRRIDVDFYIGESMRTNVETSMLADKLSEFFASYTCYDVHFAFFADDRDTLTAELSEQEKLVRLAVNRELLKPSRYFTVTNVVKHIGKVIVGSPMYISDIRKPTDSCVICGTVSGKTLKSSKNNKNMYVCRFTLSDASGGSIDCVMFTRFEITDVNQIKESMAKTDSEAQTLSKTRTFANDRKMKKMTDIYDSMEVLARGKIAYNSFSGQLEMTVYDLCKCRILPVGNSIEYNRPVAKEYVVVKPQVYREFLQTSFVSEIADENLLSGKTYAVLHINSTGYNYIKDKILSLCAVKIVDGHITEKFFTYVNPESDVSEAVLSSAKTYVDKLVFCPTITEIISDLYKFTYKCDLVGNKLARVLELLNYYATPVGYKFSNECIGQTDLLSNLFDRAEYAKKPNCAKLEDVAKACKVTFQSSSFCEETAMTLANCLTALANRSK